MLIVEKHILHPYFQPTSKGDEPPYPDIAILKLYGSSLKVHKFARLDNPQSTTDWTSTTITQQEQSIQTINYTFTTMGYGLDESNDTSNILKQTHLNYVPNPTCQALGLWDLVNQDMVCASGDGVRDSCNGDSGGPLFWQKEDGSDAGSDVQVGIVSWGVGCADERYPGVCEFLYSVPLLRHVLLVYCLSHSFECLHQTPKSPVTMVGYEPRYVSSLDLHRPTTTVHVNLHS
jgi:trypsin